MVVLKIDLVVESYIAQMEIQKDYAISSVRNQLGVELLKISKRYLQMPVKRFLEGEVPPSTVKKNSRGLNPNPAASPFSTPRVARKPEPDKQNMMVLIILKL